VCGRDEQHPLASSSRSASAYIGNNADPTRQKLAIPKRFARTRNDLPERRDESEIAEIAEHESGIARPHEIEVRDGCERLPGGYLDANVAWQKRFVEVAV